MISLTDFMYDFPHVSIILILSVSYVESVYFLQDVNKVMIE